MNRLPRTLAAGMKLVGMKNKQLAEAMTDRGHPMSENTISKILGGDRRCTFDEVVEFSAILGAPLEWLSQGPDWMRDYGDAETGGYIGLSLFDAYTDLGGHVAA